MPELVQLFGELGKPLLIIGLALIVGWKMSASYKGLEARIAQAEKDLGKLQVDCKDFATKDDVLALLKIAKHRSD